MNGGSIFRQRIAALGLSALATAADADPDALFAATAEANPRAAIGLAWSVDGAPPELRVSGPTRPRGEPVGLSARWHIGSITKSMTAALAAHMADSGDVDLDAPIATYLEDEVDNGWGALTLRDLLSHTAGVPTAFAAPVLKGQTTGHGPTDRRDRLDPQWTRPPDGTRGDFAYSNVGYVLAGVVLETVAGQPWEDLIRERIAAPAGLSSIGFGAPTGAGDPWGHRRWLMRDWPIDPTRRDADNPPWLGPAGTVHLTLEDLHRWAETLRRACTGGTAAVSAEGCAAMTTEASDGYGLGLVIQTMNEGGRFIWHNGSNTAWYAIAGFAPEAGITIAVTLNRADGAQADQLLRDVVASLLETR